MPDITLPSGVLPFNAGQFQSGNRYVANPAGTLIRNSSTASFQYSAQLKGLKDLAIIGVTFDDNGVELDKCSNITFEQCTFTDARRTKDNHQAIYGTANDNLIFRKCTWRNCSQVIQLYGGDTTLVEDGWFKDSGYGYKHGMNGGRNLTIRRCVWDGMRATMGAEIQNDGDIDGVLIEDCAYINPELFGDDIEITKANGQKSRVNANAMAFSFPMAKAKNVIGRRNYANGLAWVIDANGRRTGERRASRPDWKGLRIGCEIGGTAPRWYQNWMVNLNDPGAITTSTGAQCYDNRVQNCLEPWNAASGAQGIARLENNGPNVMLPEFGGWSLVGVSSGGTPGPTPTPPDELAKALARIAALESELATAEGDATAIRNELTTLKAAIRAKGEEVKGLGE